ncbi:MAG: DUF4255 domain-containing protein [Planctomycetota bacterium]
MLDAATESLRAFLQANVPPPPGMGDDEWVVAASLDKAAASGDKLVVSLYRIEIDRFLRNSVASADGRGRRAATPLPLDLHYVVTTFSASHMVALTSLSHALRVVHSEPVFASTSYLDPKDWHAELADGSLPEHLRIRLEEPTTDNIGHLWSGVGSGARLAVYLTVGAARVPAELAPVAGAVTASAMAAPGSRAGLGEASR